MEDFENIALFDRVFLFTPVVDVPTTEYGLALKDGSYDGFSMECCVREN